jgi:hypothetical protein
VWRKLNSSGDKREADFAKHCTTIAREAFYDTGAFYMDLWPMSGLFLTVVSPKIDVEITQTNPNSHQNVRNSFAAS